MSLTPAFRRSVSLAVLAASAGLALSLTTSHALAQGEAASTRPDSKTLLEDFVHYVNTANYPLAEAAAAELTNRKLPGGDLVKLVEQAGVDRFENASTRALRVVSNAKLQVAAGGLLKAFEDGKLAQARDPEVIKKNIENLLGTQRAKLMGREGLKRAGEYAMPQLLEAFLQSENPELSTQAQLVMAEMGRHAIVPLTAALPKMMPNHQEKVARVLGLIPYKMSIPTLADVASSTTNDSVRNAATQALQRLGAGGGDVAGLYRSLAEGYYGEKSEVTNFPGEDHQLLWGYSPEAGLFPQAVRTPVYHEAMAMQLLERGMTLEAASGGVNPESLALWVASNYSRQNDTPEGYVNPAYPLEGAAMDGATVRRSADYFGVAGGTEVAQRVLARALADRDTPLARQAIGALERVAGAKAMAATGGGALVAALNYPERRVQAEAALAIAAAQPTSPFAGSERVVPTLASTVTASTQRFAVVLAPDSERYNARRALLEQAGYTVLPQAQRLGELDAAMADIASVELVVASGLAADRTAEVVETVRGTAKTAASPLVLLVPALAYAEQQRRFEADRTIAMRPEGVADAALEQTITDVTKVALGGPVTAAEAEGYASRAIAALRDLAVSQNPVLNVADASGVLADALKNAEDLRLVELGDVLSLTGSPRAQRALLDRAMSLEGDMRAVLLSQAATNAKRFGNLLEPSQVEQVLEVARSAGDREATAASALLGALNVPNADILSLVTGGVK